MFRNLALLLVICILLSASSFAYSYKCKYLNSCSEEEVEPLKDEVAELRDEISDLEKEIKGKDDYDQVEELLDRADDNRSDANNARRSSEYSEAILTLIDGWNLFNEANMKVIIMERQSDADDFLQELILDVGIQRKAVEDHEKYEGLSRAEDLIEDSKTKIVKANNNIATNDFEDGFKWIIAAQGLIMEAEEILAAKDAEDLDCVAEFGEKAVEGCEEGCVKCRCDSLSGPAVEGSDINEFEECREIDDMEVWVNVEAEEVPEECIIPLGNSSYACDNECEKCYCENATKDSIEKVRIDPENSDREEFVKDKYCLVNPKNNQTLWSFLDINECKLGAVEETCRCAETMFCGVSSVYYNYCCDTDDDNEADECRLSQCGAEQNVTFFIDLAVSNVKISPSVPYAKEPVNISVEVRNLGNQDSRAVHVAFTINELPDFRMTKQFENLAGRVSGDIAENETDVEIDIEVEQIDTGEELNYTQKTYPNVAELTFNDVILPEEGDYTFAFNVAISTYVLREEDLSNNGITMTVHAEPARKKAVCGDRVCDIGETRDSCCNDCGCDGGSECTAGRCVVIPPKECEINSDCMSRNPCSFPTCNALTNKCEFEEINVCFNNDACCPQGCDFDKDFDCSPDNLCGDGVCDASESKENCCFDCGCKVGNECRKNKCVSSDFDDVLLRGARGEIGGVTKPSESDVGASTTVVEFLKDSYLSLILGILAIVAVCGVLLFIKTHHLTNQEVRIQEYIRGLEKKGYNDKQIKDYLVSYNYDAKEVDKLIKK